ncbi:MULTISPECIES: NAD(P)/FAD-dependent oxidoreductase [Cytobacillus]|uniref:FAD-dependent oxidoreductase n=1 Tax=Cytobacillus oceanisediminis 2691 TaxID=1196031 RepID=A0A160MBP1_9BACI|nr:MULTISPECIES: FAD-binding oxidoreductase [Cytobacillus]MBY0156458.1 FAD-binding oxidoreductase [Cytobacillus firmus]AND40319.1 FAD-dependent oxidoreductase [Cytobacillus oceanisediminis 2691]MCM3246241.1 FAD-binding oxidoreductase [Cytobacillus oceanisediminis]MCM3392292.1 FAD-binding oxidoreductase [Cytobacillus oceanisediminis]MCM3530676.1 FAD-binding oxidoreductase [Cytobacillus oceanisediminis]
MSSHADIIIIGGGVIGSSIAYNLLNDGFTGRIVVFEKDGLYEFASTPRSAGGFRQLYTTVINMQLSKYSLQIYKDFSKDMSIDGETAEIDFKQRGYLFLATDKMMPRFEKHLKLQNEHGILSQLLEGESLLNIIPELNIDDIAGGLYCSESGYLDPYSVMLGYVKYAKKLGAEYIYDEVDNLITETGKVKGIKLADGREYHAPVVVNCAGAWASILGDKAGLPLPVVPLPRQIFQFDIKEPLKNYLPLTMDPTGVYFRHEGEKFISGYAEEIEPGINFKWRRSAFEEHIWPVLANRIKNFEHAKIERGWTGLYDFNTEDHNAILGEYPAMKGYYVAFGFSGHGMQQAPAVGKCLSELIRTGNFETLDLSPLRVERFAEKDLIIEDAIY